MTSFLQTCLALTVVLLVLPVSLRADGVESTAASLAGIATGATWEKTAEWQDYSRFLDGKWRALNNMRLGPMRLWAKQAVGEAKVVYYPFSGPDFLYQDALFPDSEKLFMCGLEPIGTVPDMAAISAQGGLGNFLTNVRHSLYTIMGGSFFITTQMKTDFSAGPLNGVVPILLIFIERQGYKVDSVEYLTLDSSGGLTPTTASPNAVRIHYSDRTLVYCTYDVSNGGGSGFNNLLEKNRMGVTYLKAASYLLHDSGFTRIRDAILNNSSRVVEDDSGIPLNAFDPKIWTVNPYGVYAGPISLFTGEYQTDMDALFKKVHPAQLTFGSGYQYMPTKSSLIVAVRK